MLIASQLALWGLALIGVWALAWWMYDNLKSLAQIGVALLAPYFAPAEHKTLTERYGKWAGMCRAVPEVPLSAMTRRCIAF